MIKRTIEVSTRGTRLRARQGTLEISQDESVVARVPFEDLGALILDSPAITHTQAVLTSALEAGAVVVLCGADHLPAGMLLPSGGSLPAQRLRAQVEASKPIRKSLWKQLVQAKIRNQASVIRPECPAREKLLGLAGQVRSGDPSNVEAQAARAYWRALFPNPGFRRDRDGPPPNNLLNYGYAALRASVARALAAAGLHPALGLHHRNRGNSFCLADDMVEPLRPLVDREVRGLAAQGVEEIDRHAKASLLSVLTEEIELDGARGPMVVALQRYVASLIRCYEGQAKRLLLPRLCN